MRAARFMLARARVRPERRGRWRRWISLFSASLCLPFHCCWRRFLYLCAMLDYRWLFNIRAWKTCHSLGPRFSVIDLRKKKTKICRRNSPSVAVNTFCGACIYFHIITSICAISLQGGFLNVNSKTDNASFQERTLYPVFLRNMMCRIFLHLTRR